MKAFAELTHRGQTRRLRDLAISVLPEYPLDNACLTTIGRGFNTTFRVDVDSDATHADDAGPVHDRYLLRVHRPHWHGAKHDTRTIVASELRWLTALRNETSLIVPEPVLTRDGALAVEGQWESVPQARVCSLLRWVKGRFYCKNPKPVHLYRVGSLTAQLHNHAAEWTIPDGLVRPRWTWDAMFGHDIGFTHLSAEEAWSIVPDAYRPVLGDAAWDMHQAMAELGSGREVWGLIHADLHLENVLFSGDEARPIDFDDCGFGYWIYDIAVALWELTLHQRWPAFFEAFLEGYARHRPVPRDQLPYLDAFMVGREAMLGLVIAAYTRDVPEWLEYLDEDMQNAVERITAMKRNPVY